MIVEVKIPGAGESITEAAIGNWLVEDGSYVKKDQEVAEVETDKATLPLIAPQSGRIKIIAMPGNKVKIGEIACTVDTDATEDIPISKSEKQEVVSSVTSSPYNENVKSVDAITNEGHKQSPEVNNPAPLPPVIPNNLQKKAQSYQNIKVTPLAQKMMNENDLDIEALIKGLRKISKHEVEQVIQQKKQEKTLPDSETNKQADRFDRLPMSPLRRKLSKRLVAVKNETAMLTTFNEVDMSGILDLRKRHQPAFQEKYGQKLGLMSFFAKACSIALHSFPRVNSFIEEEEIVTPRFIDIAIAVQTEKGLTVPVIRNADKLNLAELELAIADLANKARISRLSIEEMTGGTFTITNGGVFGSMLSTPILNPPQSAILGMHRIVERPVAINGKVEIRPIMYVALSYDHRLIDGRESVSFLVKVKELLESPLKLLIENDDPERLLIGL